MSDEIMHKLCRYVRFSVNPFLPADEPGYNSFASKPAGDGLAIFLEIGVELAAEPDAATGLIVNVSDIDEIVRVHAVPIFARTIRGSYKKAGHIGYNDLAKLLKTAWAKLADRFVPAKLSRLTLKLDPFRTMTLNESDSKMVYYSEKFEFAAAHKLWNERFSKKKNIEVFGRCANPAGHGHNYIVEITIKWPQGKNPGTRNFQKVVYENLIKAVDHKNLNDDVPEFHKTNPTVENIAVFAWRKLFGKFSDATLHCVTVWESEKTYCSYYG